MEKHKKKKTQKNAKKKNCIELRMKKNKYKFLPYFYWKIIRKKK